MSTPQEVVANAIEPWTGPDRQHVTETVLEALEAAGYSVVPKGETEHLVEFTRYSYFIHHPLSCRPNLRDCPHSKAYFSGPPDELGTYRFHLIDGEGVLGERVDADGA